MPIKYTAKAVIAIATPDNYTDGENPELTQHKDYDITITSNSKDKIIELIAEKHGVKREDLHLNACEEKGRIDVCFYENDNGEEPTNIEMALFRQNKLNLWAITVTYELTQNRIIDCLYANNEEDLICTILDIVEEWTEEELKENNLNKTQHIDTRRNELFISFLSNLKEEFKQRGA